jgi:metal-responsive CopG/Arc/MetJ family transcriptional regulator
MARPKLDRKSYTATMPPELLDRLDDYANRIKQTRSDVIEDAVSRHLDRSDKTPPKPKK